MKSIFLSTLAFLLSTSVASAEPTDSVEALREVSVTAAHPGVDVIPAQTLKGDALRKLGGHSVADAMRYFSGIQIKDYGGVGGIKTVNVRSMGTNHTGVVFDGVQLGNAQNGQIDLGQYSLDNIEAISLYNGQRSQILQPARDYGNAANIYLRTRRPVFEEGAKPFRARATVRTGSFDLLNPSALVELKLSEKVNASLSAEWLTSTGRYKFRYKRVTPAGDVAYDTTAVRQNGDINATRLEASLFGSYLGGQWHAKVYNYNSERGIPGAIVNNVWRRGERVWDTNSFAQASASWHIGRYSTLWHLKYAFYRTHYENNDDRQLTVDNLYRQREIYLSSANQYQIFDKWSVGLSYDALYNTLSSDMYGFAKPVRLTQYIAAASSLDLGSFKAQASALATMAHDHVSGHGNSERHSIDPSVYVWYTPTDIGLSLRAFMKRSLRMPTFNDLYYADMGNSRLNPERVSQYDLGLVYKYTHRGNLHWSIEANADGYINRIHDKIVAYPKGQQFRWTMLNLGLVDIKGFDATISASMKPSKDLDINLRGQYTWQRALDITSPSDSYYRDQIPYIPRHSGSATAAATWKRWGINISWVYVGARYSQQENILYNYLQPWYTTDVSLQRDIDLNSCTLRARLEVNNLLDQAYDVIANYPMPGRNFRITLSVDI